MYVGVCVCVCVVSVCEVAPELGLCAYQRTAACCAPWKSPKFSCIHETLQDTPGLAGNLAADASAMEWGGGGRGPRGPSVDRPVDRSVDRCIFLGFLPWTVNLS